MAPQPTRRRFPDAAGYLRSLIGTMVWACSGTLYGIIRSAERVGRRVLLTIEGGHGKDVQAWADECSRDQNAAAMMRGAAVFGKAIPDG